MSFYLPRNLPLKAPDCSSGASGGRAPLLSLALLLLVSACTAVPQGSSTRPVSRPPMTQVPPQSPQSPPPPPVQGFQTPTIQQVPGLEWLFRQDAQSLVRSFGASQLDAVEGDMRKLQFAGAPCVLDVFLYPLSEGGEPVATHVEARRASDGQAVDRRACAEALRRR